MEGKFPSKILAFVTATTHNFDSIFCWSQMFHILPSICEGFILPSEIGFFERAFWVRKKFFVAKRHFSCSVHVGIFAYPLGMTQDLIWYMRASLIVYPPLRQNLGFDQVHKGDRKSTRLNSSHSSPSYQTTMPMRTITTRKMPFSNEEFLTDPKSPLKKSYFRWQNKALANTW